MQNWLPAVASVVLALIPVFVWISFIAKRGMDAPRLAGGNNPVASPRLGLGEKGLYIKTFLLGTLAVVPPFILIIVFNKYPQLNFYSAINRTVQEIALAALLTNIIVGVIEEIAKNIIVRVIDKRHPEHVQTLTSALILSVCAGLGFSFAENIFYFYNIWTNPQFGTSDLFATFIFRSIFTMCAHMVFSGIFGYYFGIGKFSADIVQHARIMGHGLYFVRLISKITGKMPFEIVRGLKNLQGLFIAMTMHALFNASLDLQYKLPSILIVAGGALYILYLLQTKSGHLMFSTIKRKSSSMAPRDEDVVLELLGMWTKEGRYREVAEICDRLLARDPDNNVVKLFRAKASDNQELKQVYTSLKAVFEKKAGRAQTESYAGSAQTLKAPALSATDEKVVLETINKWYKDEDYGQVLQVAKRLLEKNPNSEGAKVLLEKALGHEKMQKVFDSLTMLFKE